MSDGETDNEDVRLAIVRERQKQDESDIKDLKGRVARLEQQTFAGKIVLLTLMGLGGFFGWIINAGDKVRSWFH